jgi:hypothetical protein
MGEVWNLRVPLPGSDVPAAGNSNLESATNRRPTKPGADLNALDEMQATEGARAFGVRRGCLYLILN